MFKDVTCRAGLYHVYLFWECSNLRWNLSVLPPHEVRMLGKCFIADGQKELTKGKHMDSW